MWKHGKTYTLDNLMCSAALEGRFPKSASFSKESHQESSTWPHLPLASHEQQEC
jgi:hypothetical protein